MNPYWCLSDAECQFNKALIVEQAERIAKLEKVIVQLMGLEMGKEVLQIINTWPMIDKEVNRARTETTHGNES
jgi:hypothetical protein